MKLIKSYESFFELDFKVGNYVKFDSRYVKLQYLIGKIIDANFAAESYKCEIFFNRKIITEWIDKRYVEREATPDEIEDFKLKKNTQEYNL